MLAGIVNTINVAGPTRKIIFRIKMGKAKGSGLWDPSSQALEGQNVVILVKRGATFMFMQWFNKLDGNIVLRELSRRVHFEEFLPTSI